MARHHHRTPFTPHCLNEPCFDKGFTIDRFAWLRKKKREKAEARKKEIEKLKQSTEGNIAQEITSPEAQSK